MPTSRRICVFPGTFDPITKGHVDIILRSIGLFDKMIIGIGINSTKTPMFGVGQRVEWIRKIFANEQKIEVEAYEGLTIDFCRSRKARFILRGIRYVSDFEYEKAIADMNRMLAPEIETVFLTSSNEFSTISSTLVRDVIRNKGEAHMFLPEEVVWE